MTDLNLAPNIADHDSFYADLIDTHDGLTDAESQVLNARLILIFANHIGDRSILTQALRVAKGDAK